MKYEYSSPFNERYGSNEMKKIFSSETKFTTWRKLWIALAKAEQKLGLNITDDQINELIKFQEKLNLDVAIAREKETRHDVMAHIFAYGEQCPNAKPIIHLGATSCYVGDNTDIIVMKQGLELIRNKLVSIIKVLSDFALQYKDMPTLGFTHFQAAQLTTVGKRGTLWLQDLVMDYDEITFIIDNMKLLGSKGTTGTQASFVELFEGDMDKVKELDKLIAEDLGFDNVFSVSGQTYPRKLDAKIMNVLSSIAQSCSKFSNDIRLLQNMKEIEEPFGKNQVGSSAMAYKRNPMRSERISSISRYVITNSLNPAFTASVQWFERTLDDSANKRIAMTEGFLGTDAILDIYLNILNGIVVYPKIIEKHIMAELPFMATENIIMTCVKKGGDRQEIHEIIREHSMEAGKVVKMEGGSNDLIERVLKDDRLDINEKELMETLKPENYIGRSKLQVEEFVEEIKWIVEKHKEDLVIEVELSI